MTNQEDTMTLEQIAYALSTLTEKLVQAGVLRAEDGDAVDKILTADGADD